MLQGVEDSFGPVVGSGQLAEEEAVIGSPDTTASGGEAAEEAVSGESRDLESDLDDVPLVAADSSGLVVG